MAIGDRGLTTIETAFGDEPTCPHCGAYEDFDPCGHFEDDMECQNTTTQEK